MADARNIQDLARWNGDEPAKPKSARVIAVLGRTLEHAEHERNRLVDGYWKPGDPDGDQSITPERAAIIARGEQTLERYRVALNAYVDAVNARDLWARVKLIRRKTAPRAADALELQFEQYRTTERRKMLDELGKIFSSVRERIDADAAAVQADCLFAISQAKYQEADRQRKRDAAFNILRVSPRRKPMELHL